MKIPEYQPMQVAPEGVKLPDRAVTPSGEGYSDFNQIGKAVGQGGEAAVTLYRKQEHQARILQVQTGANKFQRAYTETFHGSVSTSSTTNLGNVGSAPVPAGADAPADGTKVVQVDLSTGQPQQTPGFLATRGQAALFAQNDALKNLEKRRQDIASEITDPEAKKLYLQETAKLYETAVQQASSHTAQQMEVAKVDSVKDGLAQTIRDVSLDPMNEQLATQLVAGQAARASALATSKEDAAAQVEAIRAEVAKTRAGVLITQQKWDAAEMVVKGSEKALGQIAAPLLDKIKDGRTLADVDVTASRIISDSLRPDGSLDEGKMFAGIEQVSPENGHRGKVQEAAKAKAVQARAIYDAGTNRLLSQAMAEYNTKGWWGMPSDLKEQLNNRSDDPRGPNLYNTLQEAAERKFKVSKASKREQDDFQRKANLDAKNDFLTLPTEVQATMDLSPTGEFAQNHPDADVHGLKALGPHQKAAGDTVDHGQGVQADKFVQSVVDQVKARLGTGRNKLEQSVIATKVKDATAEAVSAFQAYREKHSGHVPTVADTPKMVGGIVLRYPPKDPKDFAGDVPLLINQGVPRAGVQSRPTVPPPPPPQGEPQGRKIPEAARERAIARIKQSGKPVSEDLIYQVYDYERQLGERAAKKGK